MRKTAVHSCASKLFYVTWDLPCERVTVAMRACRHQQPRTAPVEVVQRAGVRGSVVGSGSSKKRTKYTPFSVVLALIFPSHHKPSSPLYQKRASMGSTVVLQRLSHSAQGTQPYPCAKNRSPLFRESFRCAAPIHIRRYRRLGWRCGFGVPAQ